VLAPARADLHPGGEGAVALARVDPQDAGGVDRQDVGQVVAGDVARGDDAGAGLPAGEDLRLRPGGAGRDVVNPVDVTGAAVADDEVLEAVPVQVGLQDDVDAVPVAPGDTGAERAPLGVLLVAGLGGGVAHPQVGLAVGVAEVRVVDLRVGGTDV